MNPSPTNQHPIKVRGTSFPPGTRPSILIVEDDLEMNQFVAETLSEKYDVISAFDGNEGLEQALKFPPTLIITDIMMPRVSGVEMIARMRESAMLADVPILLLSAQADEDLKVKLLEEGAQDFIAKPFSEKDLLVRVRNLITLRKNQDRHQTLFQSMDEGFCTIEVIFDENHKPVDYRLLEVNGAFENQTGLKNAQGRLVRELVPDLEQYWFEIYGRIAITGEPARFENHAVTLGRWYEVYAFRVGIPEKRQVGVFFNDVTHRKQTETVLEQTRLQLAEANESLALKNAELERAAGISRRFTAIVESSDDAIISKDLNSVIQTWNKGAEKIFGYTAQEVVGKSIIILIPEDQHNEEPAIMARLRRGERIEHYETVRRRKDGQLINISLTVSPIKNNAGVVVGASKIARDVTDQKRAEVELKLARDEAQRASHAKDIFLAALSHELRTPLNPVLLTASDAAADPTLSPQVRARFDLIRHHVDLEARLIDDLLDLTRISHQKMKLEMRLLHIHEILQATLVMLKNEFEQKQLVLQEKFQDRESVIRGDSVRLQQIFWNILKNAIKFTPAGGTITVATRAIGRTCEISVSDTGVGMTQPELDRAFNAFQQGDHTEGTQRFGGLGLGLTIGKELVDLHNGSITAASAGHGLGSTFTITFPLADASAPVEKIALPADSASLPAAPPLRILLVEDHQPTRETLASLLTRRHHQVVVAGSMQEALAVAAPSKFDVVISDIGLPDGSGYALFQELRRQSPGLKGIALTGYGMEDDIARGRAAGFATHLTKPIKIQSLEQALNSLL